MASQDHKNLMRTLNKLVKEEKWRKMSKAAGKVLSKSMTKSGNYRLVLEKGETRKTIYVLKKNQNLFAVAEGIKKGDKVTAALRRYLGKMYCTKINMVSDS